MKDLSEAIRLDPSDAAAFNNRGIVHTDKGNLEDALKDFNEAVRLQPDDANSHFNRAEAWEKKGDFIAAIADYQKYLDLGEVCVMGTKKR